MYVNVPLNTCDGQRFREPHESYVIPASDPVEAFVGFHAAHRVCRVEQSVEWIHDASVHGPVLRAGGPAEDTQQRVESSRIGPLMRIQEV